MQSDKDETPKSEEEESKDTFGKLGMMCQTKKRRITENNEEEKQSFEEIQRSPINLFGTLGNL